MLDLSKYEALAPMHGLGLEVFVNEVGIEKESSVDFSMKIISIPDAIELLKSDPCLHFVISEREFMTPLREYLEKEFPGRVVIE